MHFGKFFMQFFIFMHDLAVEKHLLLLFFVSHWSLSDEIRSWSENIKVFWMIYDYLCAWYTVFFGSS